MKDMRIVAPTVALLLAHVGVVTIAGTGALAQPGSFEVTDLAERQVSE